MLAQAIYYEARGEGREGMEAVANVIINRASHEGTRFPNNIAGVIKQGCEFSFRCDGSLKKQKEEASWTEAVKMAIYKIQTGSNTTSLFYHSVSTNPWWSKLFKLDVVIGGHKFYSCRTENC